MDRAITEQAKGQDSIQECPDEYSSSKQLKIHELSALRECRSEPHVHTFLPVREMCQQNKE